MKEYDRRKALSNKNERRLYRTYFRGYSKKGGPLNCESPLFFFKL